MPKDYAKFVPPKSHPAPTSKVSLALLIGGIVALALLASGTLYYLISTRDPAQPSPALVRITEFFQHKKTQLKDAAKLADDQPPKPQSIRFDFYEQLPNMQMPIDASVLARAPTPLNSVVITPPPAAKAALKPELAAPAAATKPVKIAAANPVTTAKAATVPSFNPDELTNLLETVQQRSKTLPPAALGVNERFLLDLGEFNTEFSAHEMLAAIKSVGFVARVVKVAHGNRTLYQLQQGPYESMLLALQAQQRMQKRGLISSVVKVKAI